MSFRTRLTAAAATVGALGTALVLPAAIEPAPANAYTNYYGAIALNTSTGAYGRSWDYGSYGQARSAALGSCGYGCRVVTDFVNGCGAVASSTNYWGYGRAPSLYRAQSNALSAAGGGYIYTWVCTSGHS
ncbi:DUF4189 domain-containing protein [Gordonia desulfuricans]|uniref:DUF4189 domain-containing protein n=1 Tax=Gordonia desulfuricans TaxID=89051 RepID=A0A7K3LWF2_9ACTN|nr:DUF4189 domain-containing protein [Gordonia desulfuricans]NDK92608.1 DUF4189 domain-containing protein [Gordonia desulfuricans]